MFKKVNRNKNRLKRHRRIRKNIAGTSERPRLNVFRSNKNIYAQVIDDKSGRTIVSSSTLLQPVKDQVESTSSKEAAKAVGLDVGKKALDAGIKEVVFDRGGYLYTGKVKELADGAREAGLKF